MSIPVTSDSSQRRYDKPLLAILASLALHAAVVAPFLLQLPEKTAEAPVEPSVTVEIVPEPEPPPPQPEPEATKAEKAPRSPAAAAKPESASPPPPSGATPAPAEPTPPAAPSQPFEASAAAEPDAPPDPVDMPAPDGEAKQADTVPPEPVGAPSRSPAQAAEKSDTAPPATAKAPVTEPTPGAAASPTPAPAPEQTETSSAVPEILVGTTTSGEGKGEAVPPALPKPATEPPSAEQEQQPLRETPLREDGKSPEETPAATPSESADDSPMTPSEQAAYVPATPAIPQAKPTPAPAPKPAKTLYSKNILADPRVRGALDKLPPDVRLVQICSIEALEQTRHSSVAFVPEIIKVFGRNGGLISGQHLSARGGAVRSRGVWREITFECTVNATFDTITAFRFALGGAIPRSAWASRRLPAD